MQELSVMKEYLRSKGVSNIDDLSYEELQVKYEKCIKDGVDYFNDLLKDSSDEITYIEGIDIKAVMNNINGVNQLYNALYKLLHIYYPTDVVTLIAEGKAPVSYKKLQVMVNIVYAQIQDELLDSIELDLDQLPAQERETLMFFYEKNRDSVLFLQQVHNRYKSKSNVEYVKNIASSKLAIMENYLKKHLEIEYKPYYDNSLQKKQLISNILDISKIYPKRALFDMTINDLQALYEAIVTQNKQKEMYQRRLKKYIEIFEDTNNLSDPEFKVRVEEAYSKLDRSSMSELILHFEYKSHFIANKIQNVLNNLHW